MRKLDDIWKSKDTTISTKLRIFNSLVAPILLYNSEILTVTDKMKNQIDCFQRKMLRWMINIRWPKKISNEKLKKLVKYQEWSQKIEIRRLTWLGHLLLPSECPAQIALKQAEDHTRATRSKRKTWIEITKDQLRKIDLSWEEAKKRAQQREVWSDTIKKFKKQHHDDNRGN